MHITVPQSPSFGPAALSYLKAANGSTHTKLHKRVIGQHKSCDPISNTAMYATNGYLNTTIINSHAVYLSMPHICLPTQENHNVAYLLRHVITLARRYLTCISPIIPWPSCMD